MPQTALVGNADYVDHAVVSYHWKRSSPGCGFTGLRQEVGSGIRWVHRLLDPCKDHEPRKYDRMNSRCGSQILRLWAGHHHLSPQSRSVPLYSPHQSNQGLAIALGLHRMADKPKLIPYEDIDRLGSNRVWARSSLWYPPFAWAKSTRVNLGFQSRAHI